MQMRTPYVSRSRIGLILWSQGLGLGLLQAVWHPFWEPFLSNRQGKRQEIRGRGFLMCRGSFWRHASSSRPSRRSLKWFVACVLTCSTVESIVPTEVACHPRAGAASFWPRLPLIILIWNQSEHQHETSTPAHRFHSCCALQRLAGLRIRHCKSFVSFMFLSMWRASCCAVDEISWWWCHAHAHIQNHIFFDISPSYSSAHLITHSPSGAGELPSPQTSKPPIPLITTTTPKLKTMTLTLPITTPSLKKTTTLTMRTTKKRIPMMSVIWTRLIKGYQLLDLLIISTALLQL